MKYDEQAVKAKILRKIEREINNSFGEYFSYAWRENLNEMLENESRFARLVEWINEEIEQKMSTANIFSPADKTEQYTNDFFKTFKDLSSDIFMLIYFRELLLDNRTTTKMRENIEYAIGKVFNVHYSEFLKVYV